MTLAQQQLTAAQAQLTAATAAANSGQIASANAQVTSAQSKLTAAQEALGQASLTSSIAGTVAAVNVAVGDSVTSGSSTSGSTGSTGSTGGSGPVAGAPAPRVGQHLGLVGLLGAGRRHRDERVAGQLHGGRRPTSPS